jgi:hypothetical protein
MTKFSLMIFGLFCMGFGWQIALFISPVDYQMAGWIVIGIGVIFSALVASK